MIFYPGRGATDYVLVDETELKAGELDQHTKALQQGKLVQVARHEKMVLFKSVVTKPAPAAPSATPAASSAAPAASGAAPAASSAAPAAVPTPPVIPSAAVPPTHAPIAPSPAAPAPAHS